MGEGLGGVMRLSLSAIVSRRPPIPTINRALLAHKAGLTLSPRK
jgi:hypothetical protein